MVACSVLASSNISFHCVSTLADNNNNGNQKFIVDLLTSEASPMWMIG